MASESVIPVHLQKAIVDAFQVQLGVAAQVTAATVKEAGGQYNVVSVLAFKGSKLTGSLALGFPASTFLPLVEKMLGEKYSEVNDQNADACGELLNIIYASARAKINEEGFDFAPAIPSTVVGKEVSFPVGQFNSVLKFTGETALGPFVLAFSLKRDA